MSSHKQLQKIFTSTAIITIPLRDRIFKLSLPVKCKFSKNISLGSRALVTVTRSFPYRREIRCIVTFAATSFDFRHSLWKKFPPTSSDRTSSKETPKEVCNLEGTPPYHQTSIMIKALFWCYNSRWWHHRATLGLRNSTSVRTWVIGFLGIVLVNC